MKSMVTDDGVLEKEDLFILNRMKEFISSDEVSRFAAAKHLMIQIERLVRLRVLSFCAQYSSNYSKHKEEKSSH